MARSRSSSRWLRRHVRDPYVKSARAQGYRSRAAFKLLEIDRRDRVFRAGMAVVDLGAAPGGWSQVAVERVGSAGTVVAVDLREMAPLAGVTSLQGDFRSPKVQGEVADALRGRKADVVLSDLSPNLSGIASSDQARAAELMHAAIGFCRECLAPEGAFLAKVFHGASFDELVGEIRRTFRDVQVRKPAASRGESRETYVLARGLRPLADSPGG